MQMLGLNLTYWLTWWRNWRRWNPTKDDKRETGMVWVLAVPNVPRIEESSSSSPFCCLNVFTFLSINRRVRLYSHGHLHYAKQCRWVRLWGLLFHVLVSQWIITHFPGAACSGSRRCVSFNTFLCWNVQEGLPPPHPTPHEQWKSVWTQPKMQQLPVHMYVHSFIRLLFPLSVQVPDESWRSVRVTWHVWPASPRFFTSSKRPPKRNT